MSKEISKKSVRATIDACYWALHRLCNSNEHAGKVQRLFQDLEAEADRGEREHMRFGRRLLGRNPPRKQPHETRVRYFVVKTIMDARKVYSATDATGLRRDWLLGAAIAEYFGSALYDFPGEHWEAFEALDYSEHLA